MTGIAKPNFHAGKVVILAQGTRISQLEAENRALLSEIDRLREALEPFEELADEGNEDQPDDTKVIVHAGRSIVYTLRLSDLRRARETFRSSNKEGGE